MLIGSSGLLTRLSRSTWKRSAIRAAVPRSNKSLEYSNRPLTPLRPFQSERLRSNLDDSPDSGGEAQEKSGDKSFALQPSEEARTSTDGASASWKKTWQIETHFGPLAGLTGDMNGAPVILHDRVADAESKSHAFSRRLGREEWIEKLWQVGRRHAHAVVTHGNLNNATHFPA